MNLKHILQELSQTDNTDFDKSEQRRDLLKSVTRKLALTAIPFAVGASTEKAAAKTTNTSLDTLNFLLAFQHMVAAYYKAAVTAGINNSLFPSTDAQRAFETIRDYEAAHAAFLTQTINAASPNAAVLPNANGYDYTLDGALLTFNDYKTMLAVAQVLEDTAIRVFKGQLDSFVRNNIVTDLLNIQSVKARCAAHIRQMRTTIAGGSAKVKPWVTLNQSGVANTVFAAGYAGEEATMQYGINITGIGGQAVSATAASEAFDEPLTQQQSMDILNMFLYQSQSRS